MRNTGRREIMKTSNEIKNAVGNIQYYAKQVNELVRKQANEDAELGNKFGINTSAGTIRFDGLGAIGSACNWIETYAGNILANLKAAESQDKLLYKLEEEKG